MRTLMAVVLPMLAAALVACGGSTESPVAGVGTNTATTATGRTAPARGGRGAAGARGAKANECAARGITVPPFNEGACVQQGLRFVVANGRSLMTLRTLDVAIREFAVSEALRQGGEVLTPQGVFLVIRLKVKNRTGEPQRFFPNQTLLLFEQQRLQEHTAAETRFLPSALAYKDRKPLAPGVAVEGSVIYDVPLSDAERITREGQLMVANFGGRINEIGQFRIGSG